MDDIYKAIEEYQKAGDNASAGQLIDYLISLDGDQGTQRESMAEQRTTPFDESLSYRGSVLPFGITSGGEKVLAVPEMLKGPIEGAMLPGRVLAGEPVYEQDITGMALNVGMPGSRGMVGGTKAASGRVPLSKKQIKGAPTIDDLRAEASAHFDAARGSNAVVSEDSVFNMLSNLEQKLADSGFDPDAHPEIVGPLKAINKRLGKSLDLKEIAMLRSFMSDAAHELTFAGKDKASRIASIATKEIDKWVSGLSKSDLASGSDVEGAVKSLHMGRAVWPKVMRSQELAEIFYKAEQYQSGFESGLRLQLKSLLNNQNRRSGFTKEQLGEMENIVRGTNSANALKKLARFSFGMGPRTNALLASMGAGAGGVLGGPVGAAAAPIIGRAAEGQLTRQQLLAAERLRASAAGAQGTPAVASKATGIPKATRMLGGPLLGSQYQPQVQGRGSVGTPYEGILFDKYGPLL